MRWFTLSAHQLWCQVTFRWPTSSGTLSAEPIRFENRWPLAPAIGSVRIVEYENLVHEMVTKSEPWVMSRLPSEPSQTSQ